MIRLVWRLTILGLSFLFVSSAVWGQGSFTSVAVTPSNGTAGAFTVYTIDFQTSATGNGTDTGVPADGKIRITFPAGFDVSGIEIASNVSGLDGGYSAIAIAGQVVTLTRDGTGTALAASSAASLKIASVGNTTTAAANYSAGLETLTAADVAIDTASATFAITAAPLDHFVLASIADQIAGQNFSVTVTARDIYDNDVSHTGTVTLSDNTGTLTASNLIFSSQTSQTITDATVTTATAGVVITASGSGKSGVSNSFTVTPAPLNNVRVVEGSSGAGPVLPAQSMTTDQTLLLHAAGYDIFGNYIGDEAVDWQVNGGIGSVSPQTASATTVFSANTVGSGSVTAVNATVTNGTSGTITVQEGNAHHVKILSNAAGNTSEVTTAGLTTGQTLTVHAAAFDADDNYIADVPVDWSVSGGIGDLSASQGTSTTLTASAAGTGQITADHATLIDDATGIITVTAGNLAFVKIVEGLSGDGPELGSRTLTADQTLTLHAAGYDQAGNYLSDQTVTWNSTGTLAPAISGVSATSITFAPTTAPASGSITATHATATGDGTGTISVDLGAAQHIRILSGSAGNTPEVNESGLTSGGTLVMHAASFDADGNYINDVSVTWQITGGIGTLFPASGASTTFTATTAGTGQITADHATLLDDATGTITVNFGTLAFVKIVEGPTGDGLELASKSLSADETLTLHAAGYDASGNYLGDQTVTWSSTGTLAPAINASGPSLTFAPGTAPAGGTIIAQHAAATDDTTGQISITLGAPHRVKILSSASGNTFEVTTSGLTPGDQLTVHAASFDADDNYITDVSVDWFLTGGIGNLSAGQGISTTLTATTPGTGQITADHATLIDDATGIISVNAGNLSFIKIVAGPGGDGTELQAANLTTDDVLTVHAAGYDAAGNYLGDQTVNWSSTGTLAPAVSGSGTSVSFSPSLAPASGTIFADHATATDDETGTISVSVGNAHHVKVLSLASGNTSVVTSAQLITGDSLVVHAASFDADDNYIQDVSVDWSVSGGIGTLSQAAGVTTTLRASSVGTGQITADHSTLFDDATGTITVNAGSLSFIKIVEGPSGDGLALNGKSMTADQTLTLHAAGYDASGNYVGDQTVNWSSSGNLAPAVSGSAVSITFSPTKAPASGTILASHPSATGAATGTISVSVGAEHHVKVMNNAAGNTSEVAAVGLTVGNTLTVHASSFDADDNYVQDVSVSWSVSGGIGSLSPSQGIASTFTATTPGTGQITADHATLFDDATETISVNSGTLAFVKIVEGPGGDGPELGAKSLTADGTLTLHAAGYDAAGNYLGDQSVNWSSTGTLAPLISSTAPSITFSPTKAPASGKIIADHPTVTDDQTGTITVSVGAERSVKIMNGASGNTAEVGASGLTTGEQLVVHASSFDADDNFVQDVSVSWSVSGGIGTLNPAQGVSTTFTATTPGTGQITADHATLTDDATGTIAVNSGTLAYIKIVEGPGGDGTELGTRSLTADETLTLHAAGYDAAGNYIGDQTVSWGSSGSLAPAVSGSGPSITFNPSTAPASGKIFATHATATGDSTGTISISVGQGNHVKILSGNSGNTAEVGAPALITGQQLIVHAASFDADDNYITDVSVSWSVSGGIGNLSPLQGVSTTFTATTVGSGQITADHATLIDDATQTITVSSGTLAFVKIVEGPSGDGPELGAKSMTADATVTLHAAGYDANGNYLGDEAVSWSSTGTLAPLVTGNSTSIVFAPTTAPASGTIRADHPTATDDETGTITVSVGSEHHVKVMSLAAGKTSEVNTAGLTTGNQLVVHASSFDADDNYVQDVSVAWSVSGGIGNLNPLQGIATTLTATSPGTGQITADHATFIDDATGTITVNSGNLAFIKIVEGPSGDGPELGTKTLTADETITVHAAGYDAVGNYVGDQTVAWSNTGTLAPVINSSGPSLTFNPTLAPASGRIIATHATATDDSTGVISIAVGAEHHVKVLNGASASTTEVGTAGLTTGDQFVVHAASFDADDNYVQDVSVSWSLSGGIGTLNPAQGIATTLTATTPGTGQITADHATLIDDATGTISVSSGTLDYLKIVEGPSGDGPELGARSLTADETLTLHAAGYDAAGNYIGDQSVTWTSSGSLAPAVNETASAIVFSPTTAPASGTIQISHASATGDATGLISVAVGQERYVSVLSGATGPTAEVGNASLTTGQTLTMHAASFDADNNYVTDVPVSWIVSSNIGTLNPTSGVATTFTATTAGSGVITADHATLIDDATGTITVTVGGLSYVKIVEGPAGDGAELGTKNLTTDNILTVHAAGYDSSDNYLGDQSVNWSVTGGIGTVSPLVGASTTLTLTTPGSGRLVADHATATDDSSGTLTVTPGALFSVKVMVGDTGNTAPVSAQSLTTDATLIVHAGGFDVDDNYISDVPVQWTVSGGIGTIAPATGISATFNPTRVGNGQITATHATANAGQSGIITVTPGALSFIKIVAGPEGDGPELLDRGMTADETLTLHAAGYDADSNYVADQSVDWSSTGTLTPAIASTGSASVTFAPTLAPASGTIQATHATAGSDETGTITVNVGSLNHVLVLTGGSGETTPVGATSMNPGDTLLVHAGGFDADDNYIADQVVNWSVIGPIGTISPASGTSATFTALTVGTGSIRADASGTVLDGASGTITVSTGTVAKIILRTAPNNGGTPFNDFTMSTDDEVTIYAAGYDAGNNYFGDVSVQWSSTGTLSPAVSATSSSFNFSPVTGDAGGAVNGRIVGVHAPGISDSTGLITVLPGAPVGEVTLAATPPSLQADGTSTSLVTSTEIQDAEGNPVGPNRLFTVTLTPVDIGTIVTPDADPATPGRQVATTDSSRLNFTFRAGTVGGIATLNVSSGLAASGQVQISLGSLAITSIATTPAFVTQGQSGITVSMTVQNLGSSTITNLQGNLTFTGTADRTSEYTVVPGSSNATSLAAGAATTLTYLVSVSATATLEAVTIDGSASGQIGAAAVSATGAATPDAWTVQAPAGLSILSVTTASDTVAQGQTDLTVTVRVENNLGQAGTATALVDSLRLKFSQGPVDRSVEYIVAANPSNPDLVPGNGTADFTFTVNVGASASLGEVTIDAEIFGRDANALTPVSDLNAATPDTWVVVEGNAFSIAAIVPSQPAITAGMVKTWQVSMELVNSGSSEINLDLSPAATYLQFAIGVSDVSGQYTVIAPAALDEGGTALAGGATGHLTFQITQTGSTPGIMTIAGFAAGQDNATGLPVSDDTRDFGSGEVQVQTKGLLNITLLQASQSTVTAGRTADWRLTASVSNPGGSAVRLLPDSIKVDVGGDGGYQFVLPAAFTDGDTLIGSNESKTLEILVDRTGTLTGNLAVSLLLGGRELNSDRIVQSNPGGTVVQVQSPAALQITGFRASRLQVTAGQTNPWEVFVRVQNAGESQVVVNADTTTNLRFRIGTDLQTDYVYALQPAAWLGSASTTLAGNTSDSLRFVINTTGAFPGFLHFLPKISVKETNSDTLLAATATSGALVQVQLPPVVTYIDSSMLPDVVNSNGFYVFKVRVNNAGESTVLLEPDITTISFTDGSATFTAALDANKVRSIPPGDTTLTFRQAQVPAAMQLGRYTPTVVLRGTENDNAFFQTFNVAANELLVAAPASVQILAMQPSQPTVTSLMEKDWFIDMVVANNGGTAITADSMEVVLFNGGVVTQEFIIVKPDTFLASGTTLLAAGRVDTLRFTIQKTGIRTGATTIQGRLWFIDQSTQERDFIQTDSGGGNFVVQTPAQLQIMALRPSQPTVTQNQTRPWTVDMEIKNVGGSTVKVNFAPDSTGIDFSLRANGDYLVTPPVTLLNGDSVLAGGDTGVLRFTVTTTGGQIGTSLITGRVTARELNSNVLRLDDTTDQGQGQVQVQTPARLRVKSVVLTGAPNLPFVNTNQPFSARMQVENFGQETADSVTVRLASNGQSIIALPSQRLPENLAGGATADVTFAITAGGAENPNEIFTGAILSATAHNTGLTVLVDPAVDDTARAHIQLPATLEIVEVTPSQENVSAEQNIPWTIYVVVRNAGGAALQLEPPSREDIQIFVAGTAQADYVITPPATLSRKKNLVLFADEVDTLAYVVTSTGRVGGQATLVATTTAQDINTLQSISDQASGSILVETTAAVRILETRALVNHLLSNSDVGLVNLSRTFSIQVTVENTGFEPVENVLLQLATDGNSLIAVDTVNIAAIPAREQRQATFLVQADSVATPPNTSEIFTATIIRAIATQSQEPATINLPIDGTAQIRIQEPARLVVSASLDDEDGILSTNQVFDVIANVQNVGQAEVDDRGQLTLELPPGFTIEGSGNRTEAKAFRVGENVIWRVRAPDAGVDSAQLLVWMSAIPIDKNAAKQSLVDVDRAVIGARVVEFDLSITKVSITAPPGGMDDTLSTGQTFTLTTRIAFSADLAGNARSVTLHPPPGLDYKLVSPSSLVIENFTDTESWTLIAPAQPHSARGFIVLAEGITGTGEPKSSTDTLAVTVVSKSLLELQARISEPEGARDNTLSTGQHFTLRASLNNLGTAAAVDTAIVRLEPGSTGIAVADTNEKVIPVNGFVEWQAQAPEVPAVGDIIVRLIQRPKDENSGLDAEVLSEISRISIVVDTTGSLSVSRPQISGPLGATDGILSTGQTFTVSAELQWNNLKNVSAKLLLPVEFITEDARRNFTELNGPATPSWIVQAPQQPVAAATIRVELTANDASNDTLVVSSQSLPLQIDVVPRALLHLSGTITAPRAATDGIVSVNQPFEITGRLTNVGQAGTVGVDSIFLSLPEGYSTAEPRIKSTVNGEVKWLLKAKSTPSNGLERIELVLQQRPRDENSGLPADVEVGVAPISIQTEGRQLLVRAINTGAVGPTASGQQDLHLLSLFLENQGNENSSDILLRGLAFDLIDGSGAAINPQDVFQGLRVVSRKRAGISLGEFTTVPAENPLQLTFTTFDTLHGGVPDTIDVIADLRQSPATEDFQLRFSSSQAFDAIDADSRESVQIIDETGATGEQFKLLSETSVLAEAEYEAFYNYPNPFNPLDGDGEGTYFYYYLPSASDVEFKIFTLLGELVFEASYPAGSPQGRAGGHRGRSAIHWDGRNGNGVMVLNGVYLAVLKTSFGTVKTKVAVAK